MNDDDARLRALERYGILDTPPEPAFDDIVALARRLCGTPVALVSLVAGDRQWFKARAGFGPPETDLDRSVCAHVVAAGETVVIPDLRSDPRTRANPLVAGEPGIRFYAGAPLATADGHVLGALCVIDTEPRPDGLLPGQADALAMLARQVVSQLELRRAMAEREAGEARYRTLFEAIDSGFCVIEVRFDGTGRAVDYRFLETNPAFARQTGLEGAEGRWMREIAPDHERHWFDAYGRVALTGEPARFENGAAALGRWFEVSAFRVGPAGLRQVGVLFSDVTGRRQAELARRRSEESLQLALAVSDGIGAWDWDLGSDLVTSDPGFARLYGVDPASAAGGVPIAAFLRNVHPEDLPRLRDAIGGAIGTGEQLVVEYRLLQPDGSVRWVVARGRCLLAPDGRPARLPGVGLDVTERRREDARQVALLRLGDELRNAGGVADAVATASAVLGETLAASRAGYAIVDAPRGRMTVWRDRTAGGAASLAGTLGLEAFAATVERLRRGEVVVTADVREEAWLAPDLGGYDSIATRAQVKVPLTSAGELVGVLFVHHATPRAWAAAEVEFAKAVADRTHATVARLTAEAEQRLLNRELSHRLKNTLAMVQAIASQTLRGVGDRDAVEAFDRRILALSTAHDVLMRQSWDAARIGLVVEGVLALHGGQRRFEVGGPNLDLGPKAVLSLSLLLHELATNAAKHGALSADAGTVAVRWEVRGDGRRPGLVLRWEERGGPPIAAPPARRGFGSRLIGMGLSGTRQVDLRYLSTGLVAEFTAPLAIVTEN